MGESFFGKCTPPADLWFPEQTTDIQRMFYDSIAQFADTIMGPAEAELAGKNYPLARKLFLQCAELGVFAAELDEADDGLGLGVLDATLLSEAIGRGNSLSVGLMVHQGVGMLPIACFGNDRQRRAYLPGAASGERIMAFALTEPHCGSDALALNTSALLVGEQYVLNGTKQFITNAAYADTFITFARIPDVGITAFLVNGDTPGLSIGPEEKKLGQHASSTCSVRYEDVRVSVDAILGEPGAGHRIALNMLNLGRLKLAAGCVGKMKVLLPQAVDYVQERIAFGKPIATFGMLQDRIARMAALLYAVESTVYRVASVMENALKQSQGEAPSLSTPERVAVLQEFALECALLKSFATESLGTFTDDMLQLYGGYGFSEEYPAAKAYRDARVTRLYEGTTEICRLTLLQRLFAQCTTPNPPTEDEMLMASQKRVFQQLLQADLQLHGDNVKQLLGTQAHCTPLATAFEGIYAAESVLLRRSAVSGFHRDLVDYFAAITTAHNVACYHQLAGDLSKSSDISSSDYATAFPRHKTRELRDRVVQELLARGGLN